MAKLASGLPIGMLPRKSASGPTAHSKLIGYAADGFPIYALYGYANTDHRSKVIELKSSYQLKSGTRPNGPGGEYDGRFVQDYEYIHKSGDLDKCNGRFAVTPEYPKGTYHYVLTSDFPVIPRCFSGRPDASFAKKTHNRPSIPPKQ